MITAEEMAYCFWLTSEAWDGSGDVVEVGPWLGGSTWCLASGMESNPRSAGRKLHAIDNFRWRPFMSKRAPLNLKPDSSFRPYFERNLAPKRELLVVHEAALPDDDSARLAEPGGVRSDDADVPPFSVRDLPGNVGVLFIDGAKSWRALRCLLLELGPRLIPGKTLIVCQDLQHWLAYWVPMLIGVLLRKGSLEPLHTLKSNTVSFRVGSSDLATGLDSSPENIDRVGVGEGIASLRGTAQVLEARGDHVAATVVHLSEVAFLGTKGAWNDATETFREAEATWPWSRGPINQLEQARTWLEANGASPPSASARAKLIARLAHTRAAVSRRISAWKR